jgi:hypothetical protein
MEVFLNNSFFPLKKFSKVDINNVFPNLLGRDKE